MNNIIKPHIIKPRLEKLTFDLLPPPANGATVNIKAQDKIDIRKTREELVTVTVERSLVIEPQSIMRLSVVMAVDIPVDGIEFNKLEDPKSFIKASQPTRALLGQVSYMITGITSQTGIGPIVTPPEEQQ